MDASRALERAVQDGTIGFRGVSDPLEKAKMAGFEIRELPQTDEERLVRKKGVELFKKLYDMGVDIPPVLIMD
mgnify:CR=1 FL=1|jgi:hypothetical protein